MKTDRRNPFTPFANATINHEREVDYSGLDPESRDLRTLLDAGFCRYGAFRGNPGFFNF